MRQTLHDQKLDQARVWLDELRRRVASFPGPLAIPADEVLEELSNALEELAVAGEEISHQNEELAAGQQAIVEERARYQELFDLAPDGYLVTDPRGTIREANCAAVELLGVRASQLAGKPLVVFVPEHARPFYRSRLARLRDEKSLSDWRIDLAPRTGGTVTVEITVATVHDTSGEASGLLWLLRDVREKVEAAADRKALERELFQTRKMEAIGRLAGGIAHDFGNLLTGIIGYTELLINGIPEGDGMRARLEEIRNASLRGAALTRQLLSFCRENVFRQQILNAREVMCGMEPLLRSLLGEDIDLVLALDPDTGNVLMGEGQIEQVVMNLAVNARDAMPRGGRLDICLDNTDVDEVLAARRPGLCVGSHVRLRVSDTGDGMDEETRSRLFEPFFTTKKGGRGTGLGLSTTYGIVKRSGGDIRVESGVDEGTAVEVLLPRSEREKDEDPDVGPAHGRVHTETVLLVEDEPALLDLADQALGSCGYTVLAADCGAEALRLEKEHDGPLDILVSDVVMPGLSGPELAAELVRRRPGTKVLFMSGYGGESLARYGATESDVPVLAKPFRLGDLLDSVRDVLDRSGAS